MRRFIFTLCGGKKYLDAITCLIKSGLNRWETLKESKTIWVTLCINLTCILYLRYTGCQIHPNTFSKLHLAVFDVFDVKWFIIKKKNCEEWDLVVFPAGHYFCNHTSWVFIFYHFYLKHKMLFILVEMTNAHT